LKVSSHYRVYTDGASSGNPGPAGIGVVVERDGEVLAKLSRYVGETTNNVAEYLAFLYGLGKALELGARDVIFLSDSDLLVKQVKGIYRVKDRKLRDLHRRVMERVRRFRSFNIEHVNRRENSTADGLARRAISSFRSGTGGSGEGRSSSQGRSAEQAGRLRPPQGGEESPSSAGQDAG